MNEKDFMRQVSAYAMPDVAGVKELCLIQLNENKENKTKTAWFAGAIAAAVLLVCLCVPPVNSLAKNMLAYIRTMINVKGFSLEFGDTGEFDITIPEDCEPVEYEGVTYLSKGYDTVSDLTDDIGINIYTWKGDAPQVVDVMLNIVENDYGRVAVVYDTEEVADVTFALMVAYFPLSKDADLVDLLLQNEEMVYHTTIDDDGNVEEYWPNTEYELVEKYESDALDTTVTVIAEKTDTEAKGDLGELNDTALCYHLYFTKDGVYYRINTAGTLDGVHEMIEEMAQ